MNEFLCPRTRQTLRKDADGNLFCTEGNEKYIYRNYNGSIDFAGNTLSEQERSHYDHLYGDAAEEMSESLHFGVLEDIWCNPYIPWNKMLIQELQGLRGKTVLLLGNGSSTKEFYFLKLGANLIYTDLSLNAVLNMKEAFGNSSLFGDYGERVSFHSVDALELPFLDESVDMIYGYAFMHHIEDLGELCCEFNRVVKEGGICVFFDNAYSPFWQFAKATILRPLQKFSHRKHGLSPEDLRATHKGGFTEEEVKGIARDYSFESCFFERTSFFLQLWCRGTKKLLNSEQLMKRGMPLFSNIDDFLSKHSRTFQKNQLNLVWGFRK